MLSSLKWVLPAVAAIALLLGINAKSVKAADEPAASVSITGKVVDAEGAAVADATVNLTKPRAEGETGRPTAITTAKTDKDGKFELKADKAKVADGPYNVSAMVQGKGRGTAKVTVKDGKADPAEVSIKLAPRTGGGGGGGAAN